MTTGAEPCCTAIVHVAGGVNFVASARCPEALSEQLARYVLGRCDDVLWPEAARQVRALFDAGRPADAIALYFDRTGRRWERERLELVTLEQGGYWIPDEERMADAGR